MPSRRGATMKGSLRRLDECAGGDGGDAVGLGTALGLGFGHTRLGSWAGWAVLACTEWSVAARTDARHWLVMTDGEGARNVLLLHHSGQSLRSTHATHC